MRFSYPYKKELDITGFIYRPKIPIRLYNKGRSLDTIGLLDSGSDTMSIPLFMAEDLGIKLNPKKHKVHGIGGIVEVKYGLVNVMVESRKEKHRIRAARVVVPLNDDDQMDDVLIGRQPFFEHFRITFDENAKRVTLTRVKRY